MIKQKLHQKFVKYKGFHVTNISDKLYVGSCPKTKADITTLKKIGITSVLCLQRKDEDCTPYTYPNNWKSLHVPVYDCGLIKYEEYLKSIKFIAEHSKCYIHCRNGRGRSRTCVYFYLRACGKSDKESRNLSGVKTNAQYLNAKHKFETIYQSVCWQ